MSTSATAGGSAHHDLLLQAVQEATQGSWVQVVTTLQPAAEGGDLAALVLSAWAVQQGGLPIEQAIAFADATLAEGIVLPAMWTAGRLLSEPSQHETLLRLVDGIFEVFPGWDIISWFQTITSQGYPDTAARLVEIASRPRPRTQREVEALRAQADSVLSTLQGAAATVDQDRARASEAIGAYEAEIDADRERVSRLVTDTTRLVHEVAADHMAQSYSERAETTLAAAFKWTVAAIVAAVVAVGWGIYVGIHVASTSATTSSVVGKALVTVPLLAVAAYLGSIAASTRRMGWHWRHVELQIRTAEPFIAELDDDTRKALQAALAIRFFPGQGQDPQHAAGAQNETLDLSTVIAEVFRDLRGARTPTS